MHRADVDISFAGYVSNGTDKSGSIQMVTEQEVVAAGDDIHPEVVHLDDVTLTISNRARYCGSSHCGIDLERKQVGEIMGHRLFLFADSQAVLSGNKAHVDQVDSFFACLLQ